MAGYVPEPEVPSELREKAERLRHALGAAELRTADDLLQGEDALEVALAMYHLISRQFDAWDTGDERERRVALVGLLEGLSSRRRGDREPELNPSFDDKLLQMTAEYASRRLAEAFKDSSNPNAEERPPTHPGSRARTTPA